MEPPGMEPAEAVLRFLESIGRRSEAEFYLALFRAEAKERFAALVVDAQVARHAMDAVVLDLRFLAALGLVPVVVLGLHESADTLELASRLRRRLEKAGVKAVMIPAGQGPAAIAAAVHAGTVPVVPFPNGEPTGNDDRLAGLGALLTVLQTRKLIFLSRRGAFRQKGAPVNLINLTTEYEAFASSRELSRKQHTLLGQARRLIFELVPHKLLIAVTSPLDLLHELFTVRGAGTLLRRGATIERHEKLGSVDRARLRALLTSAFGRPPVEAFWDRPVSRIYLEESYRGAAVLIDTPLGGYLTKFAVDREAQGEGMGRDLWSQLAADYATIFWRARPENPINAWYTIQCDGLARSTQWHVFWKGLAPARIPDAIAWACAQPVDIPQEE